MKKLSRGGVTVGHKAEKVDKAREALRQRLKEAREAAAVQTSTAAPATDAESVEPRETYDYIIVGAGTAGCTLAYSLVKGTKNRVLVLEAGPSDTFAHDRITTPFLEPTVWFEPTLDWNLYTADQELLSLYSKGNLPLYGYHYPRCKVVGGQSSSNSMIYIRGRPDNYDAWADLGPQFKNVWNWNVCLESFKATEKNARKDANPKYHGFKGKYHVQDQVKKYQVLEQTLQAFLAAGVQPNDDFNGDHMHGAGFFQVNQKNGQRSPQYTYLYSALKERVTADPANELPAPPLSKSGSAKMTGLNVRTDALVTRILFEDPKDPYKATGVEYLHDKFLYKADVAKEVILSAGPLHTPQILMLSGIGHAERLAKHKIPVLINNEHVGFHLKEHPIVPITAGIQKPSQVTSPIYTSNGAQLGCYIKVDADGKFPDVEKTDQSKADMQFNCAADIWDQDILAAGYTGDALTIGCCFNEPESEGWLELQSDSPVDQPLIYLNSFSHPADMKKMISGVKFAKKIIESKVLKEGAGAVDLSFSDKFGNPKWGHGETDAQLEIYIRNKARTSFHPMCTTRMSPTAATGVVDHLCRVHGARNLRVIDSSVFPDYISGNLNAPTCMLAHRMGELIKSGAI